MLCNWVGLLAGLTTWVRPQALFKQSSKTFCLPLGEVLVGLCLRSNLVWAPKQLRSLFRPSGYAGPVLHSWAALLSWPPGKAGCVWGGQASVIKPSCGVHEDWRLSSAPEWGWKFAFLPRPIKSAQRPLCSLGSGSKSDRTLSWALWPHRATELDLQMGRATDWDFWSG